MALQAAPIASPNTAMTVGPAASSSAGQRCWRPYMEIINNLKIISIPETEGGLKEMTSTFVGNTIQFLIYAKK
jgi:hypothetical protein